MSLPFPNYRNIDFVLVFDTLGIAREFSGEMNVMDTDRVKCFVKIAQIFGKQEFKFLEKLLVERFIGENAERIFCE